MDLARYIYLYASRVHKDLVKCVLAQENLRDTDADVLYVRQLRYYLQFREMANEHGTENMKAVLDRFRQRKIEGTYSSLFEYFIGRLRMKMRVEDKLRDMAKEKLSVHRDKDCFNLEYVKTIRNLEEHILINGGKL